MKKIVLIAWVAAFMLPTITLADDKIESPTQEESPVEKVVAWYMDNMNYGTVALLMTVESSFIPFPSEVIIPPAAYKASQEGSDMNIVLVVMFGTLGALIGALFNYYLALWLGRPIIYRFAGSRFGHFCLITEEKVDKAEKYFYKHGNISTLIGRLIPVIRQLISLPAGLARMRLGNFILYTSIGALVWNIVLAVIGYVAHGRKDLIEQYSKELSYILLGMAVLFLLYLCYNGFKRRNSEAAHR